MFKKIQSDPLIRFLPWSPLIFLPFIVLVVIGLSFSAHKQSFEKSVSSFHQNLLESENKALKTKVDGVVEQVNYQQSIIEENLVSRVKDRVDSAYKIARSLIEQYQHTKSSEEIQAMITTTLRTLIWNDGESFIWMLDYDGVFKLAPEYLRHLEGTSIINFQDATGRFVIQEEIALCKNSNGGFLWDTFTKPGDTSGKQYKQVAYVRPLDSYDWYLGSGEYLDTAMNKTNNELLTSIHKLGSETGYFFVVDTNGNSLLNASLDENIKTINVVDDPKISYVYDIFKDALQDKNGTFVSYDWVNPTTKLKEKKYGYISRVHGNNWIIGSGFYESEIKQKADEEVKKLYEHNRYELQNFVWISVFWMLLAIVVSFMLSRLIRSRFNNYEIELLKTNQQLESLNENLELKVLDRTSKLEDSRKAYQKLANTDSLTGIYNRLAFTEFIDAQMEHAQATDKLFGLIMFDVDHFKDVNDTYGHDVGDEVLIELVKVVGKSLRGDDVFVRYGGEEFIIILPTANLEQSTHLAERIRVKVENHPFAKVKQITLSVGVIEYQKDESRDDLFKRVDNLLYQAKNSGRNRVEHDS